MPIFGHKLFLATTQPFLGQLGLEYYESPIQTIIYQLVERNPRYDSMILIFHFRIFGIFLAGKWRGHHARP